MTFNCTHAGTWTALPSQNIKLSSIVSENTAISIQKFLSSIIITATKYLVTVKYCKQATEMKTAAQEMNYYLSRDS